MLYTPQDPLDEQTPSSSGAMMAWSTQLPESRLIPQISAAIVNFQNHAGLTALKHPNIIRLVQHINSPQNVIMVFELAEGGDLYQFLCSLPEQRVKEDDGRAVFRQVCEYSLHHSSVQGEV